MADTKQIKGLTIAKGLTQQKLAERLKMDKSTLSRKINNQAPFTVEEVRKIVEILEIDESKMMEIFFN